MVSTPAIHNLDGEGKAAQIYSAIQAVQNLGMQTPAPCLTQWVRANKISMANACSKAINKDSFIS